MSPGTRSSSTLSISRCYGREDSERHSQSRGSLPVKKCTSTLSSQAELKENMKRSNTEGAQLRNLYEKTRNANANIAPEVICLQSREPPLSTRASTMRNQETELQTQLLSVHQENAGLHVLFNQIRITNSLMHSRGLAQQLQTPNLELSGLQTEVSHLRTSEGRNPSTECRDAENLRNLMAK